MSNDVISPQGIALWTNNCFDPDKKYPHKSGKGHYSLTLSLNKKGKEDLENLITTQLGAKASGTVHYKSDGTGRTEVKFKCLESLTDRQGNEVQQPPKITFEGKPYKDSFEHATVKVVFQPKFFSAYGKTSMLLKGVWIQALHDPNTPTSEDLDNEVVNFMNTSSGNA